MYIDRTCLVTKWLNSKWVKSNCHILPGHNKCIKLLVAEGKV